MTQQATPHGFVTRSIHWLSAAMLGYGYLKGLEDVSQLADPALFATEIVFALALGGLFLIRMIWTKAVAGASRLPAAAPRWEHAASRLVHRGLYGSVFGIILSGLAIAWAYSTPLLSGLFLDAMIGAHEAALTVLPMLLIAHILGALWHKLIRRDAVMESMTGRLTLAAS